MQLNRFIMSLILLAPLSMAFTSAHAQRVVEESTKTTTTTNITTAVPPPKETIVEPIGYASCTTVAAGWNEDTWHEEYQVCRYDTKAATVEGEAWIAGHWRCSEYAVGCADRPGRCRCHKRFAQGV